MIRLKKHYDELENLKESFNKRVFSNRTLFKCALTSSFSKSIHLGITIFNKDKSKESYYLTSNLRGVCEEIIVLKYIHSELFPVRNKVMGLLMTEGLRKDLEAQNIFFKSYHPFQPILKPDNSSLNSRKCKC